MNKAGLAILVVGFLALIIGAYIAITSQDSANSMSLIDRALHPDKYDSFKTMVTIGWVTAGVGVLLVVVGLVIAVAGGRNKS